MKKAIIALAFSLIALNSFGQAGLGVALSPGDFLNAPTPGVALNVAAPFLPGTILGISGTADEDGYNFGLYNDWWLYNEMLAGPISLYLGPGFYVTVTGTTGDNGEISPDAGIRMPIGFQFFPIAPIELFFELVPTVGAQISPTFKFPVFGIQGGLGIRFWFTN